MLVYQQLSISCHKSASSLSLLSLSIFLNIHPSRESTLTYILEDRDSNSKIVYKSENNLG